MEFSAALNVGESRRFGRDEPVCNPELLAERDAFGFLRQDRIGTAVDDEIADVLAQNHAAGTRCALEDRERQAVLLQFERGAQSGDAAAHYDDVGRHRSARTIDSSAEMNVGDVFSDSVRRRVAPASLAARAACTSMSNSTSV